MFNNFHEIKAVISNHQGFRASFYGIAEYVQGMISNRFKFKNPVVQAKLYLQIKFKDTSVKFENNILHAIMCLFIKPTDNVIKVTSEISTKFISIIKPTASNITFLDKPIQKLNTIFVAKIKDGNNFEFENPDAEMLVALQGKPEENDILIDNNNEDGVHTTISLIGKADDNKFSFENSTVNASAWKFLTLGDISGTLNEIEKSPLEYLGRRKIVQ